MPESTGSTEGCPKTCYVVELDGTKCDGITGVPGTAKGLCNKHYNRFLRYGDVYVRHKKGRKPGPGHHQWKGDQAGYQALHRRVYRRRGKASCCEHCGVQGQKRYEWATKHGTDGTDVMDYISLCRACHRLYDFGRLTLEERREIRDRAAAGESQTSRAREFGIHPSVISRGLDPDVPKWQTRMETAS